MAKILLYEKSRNSLIAQSKVSSSRSKDRFARRMKSKVAGSVKQFNKIDMNSLFKENILTVDVSVRGETDDYEVKISFGGFIDYVKREVKRKDNILDLRAITVSLTKAFNAGDVYIHCTCPDAKYRFDYWQTKDNINSGAPQNIPSNETNPNNDLGSGCKHALLVLTNSSWLLKVASVINNYIKYMEKNYNRLYADIIYPAIYDKKYEKPVQLDIFDDGEDNLDSDETTLDMSNEQGRVSGQFKSGNTQGIRFAKETDKDQINLDDLEDETEDEIDSN